MAKDALGHGSDAHGAGVAAAVPNKATMYRGKYPGRINEVAGGNGKPGNGPARGEVWVKTNGGDRYSIMAHNTGGVMPKGGEDISSYPHAVPRRFNEPSKHNPGSSAYENPAERSGISWAKHARANFEKGKVNG